MPSSGESHMQQHNYLAILAAAIVAFLIVHVALAALVPKSLRAMIIGG